MWSFVGDFRPFFDPFIGSPQYVYSDQFANRGKAKMAFLIEGAPLFPLGTGAYFPAFGAEKQAIMDLLPHLSLTAAFVHDGFDLENYDEGAVVSVRPQNGLPRVDYPWTERLVEGLREATRTCMHIQIAGGAKQVLSPHPHYARTHQEVDAVIDRAEFAPCRLPVFVAHVMGGCPMGTNERLCVVDSRTMRHHGFDNMFVIDGSVFPTSLTVNPQISIYGLGLWASEFVAQAAS
jgi:choline dehydrogenase-like flavoprotein